MRTPDVEFAVANLRKAIDHLELARGELDGTVHFKQACAASRNLRRLLKVAEDISGTDLPDQEER